MRVALRLEYDGTDFHGSQLQASQRTVQGELERALAAIFKCTVRPKMASRTDTGVHAKYQVAACDIQTAYSMKTLTKALNYHLADDISIRFAQQVSDRFDPRHNATSRKYSYTIRNSASPSPIARRYETHIWQPLNIQCMGQAAQLLEGIHNFSAFAGPATPRDAPTIRRMYSAKIENYGNQVTITFRANAFLNQQVRRMVGALVLVGKQKLPINEFGEIIENSKSYANNPLMPPHGLCLIDIKYPESGPGALLPS